MGGLYHVEVEMECTCGDGMFRWSVLHGNGCGGGVCPLCSPLYSPPYSPAGSPP